MTHSVILGTQWGDEGKGKIIDTLARQKKFKAVVRFQGGNNAGHTVVVGKEKHAFHLLPSGILYPDKTCVIGNGVVVNPEVFLMELNRLRNRVGLLHAKILISEKAHIILPWHMIRDAIAGGKIGTTGRGIGPTYTDYVQRRGIRFVDTRNKKRFTKKVNEELTWNRRLIKTMFDHYKVANKRKAEFNLRENLNSKRTINKYWKMLSNIKNNSMLEVGDVSLFLEKSQNNGDGILFEGAQAALLDIAHGTYPYVTSSNPTIGGLYAGTGFRPKKLKVIGVSKAYTTRVGGGPFPTELFDDTAEKIRKVGNEYGTTTGRPRRCGWYDATITRYSKIINGIDELVITKLDILTGIEKLRIAIAYKIGKEKHEVFRFDLSDLEKAKVIYEDFPGWKKDITNVRKFEKLPPQARKYIKAIEKYAEIPVKYIGVGPARSQIIRK